MEIEVTDDIRVAPESENMIRILSEAFEKKVPIDINGKQYAVVARSKSVFSLRRLINARPAPLKGEGLPPLESTVRIVPGDTPIWDVAEKFVDVDCRLKAVFMLDETQMVAVENIGTGQCCCFWASMVRTPEQAKAEERMNKAIALYTAVMNHPGSSLWHRLDQERQEHFLSLVDAGWQQVKP